MSRLRPVCLVLRLVLRPLQLSAVATHKHCNTCDCLFVTCYSTPAAGDDKSILHRKRLKLFHRNHVLITNTVNMCSHDLNKHDLNNMVTVMGITQSNIIFGTFPLLCKCRDTCRDIGKSTVMSMVGFSCAYDALHSHVQ